MDPQQYESYLSYLLLSKKEEEKKKFNDLMMIQNETARTSKNFRLKTDTNFRPKAKTVGGKTCDLDGKRDWEGNSKFRFEETISSPLSKPRVVSTDEMNARNELRRKAEKERKKKRKGDIGDRIRLRRERGGSKS